MLLEVHICYGSKYLQVGICYVSICYRGKYVQKVFASKLRTLQLVRGALVPLHNFMLIASVANYI